MSAGAVAWTYRHSPYDHGAFAVHQALADAANDLHDNELWFRLDKLAAKARVKRSTAQAAVSQMVRDGYLEIVRPRGGQGSSAVHRFVFKADAPVIFRQEGGGYDVQKLDVTDVQNLDVTDLTSKKLRFDVQKTESCPLIEPKGTQARARESFVSDFDACWKHYPRKEARKAALRAYQARRRAGVSADDLLTAVRLYAESVEGSEKRFVKHGSTFFGPDDHWRDFLEASEPEDPYDVQEEYT